MTTATTSTSSQQKVCAQSLAALASVGILIHFVHELATELGTAPVIQFVIGAVVVAATLATMALWYRMSRTVRRALAVVLGSLWAIAASEHVGNLAGDAAAIDYTGLLTFAGGLLLVFAAFYDHVRPMEPTR